MSAALSASQEIELLRVLDLYERRGRVGGTPTDIAAAVASLTPWTARARSEALASRGCLQISACSQRLLRLTEAGRGLLRGGGLALTSGPLIISA